MNSEEQTRRTQLLDSVHTNIMKNKVAQRILQYEILAANSETCTVHIVQEMAREEAPIISFLYSLIGRKRVRHITMEFMNNIQTTSI